MDTRQKIVSPDEVQPDSNWALAYGRFDVLTADHCRVLSGLAAGGAQVVVVVAADSEVQGALLDERSRAQLVAALGAVNHVVVCDEAEREKLFTTWNPSTVVDVESQVTRNVVADVLARHGR